MLIGEPPLHKSYIDYQFWDCVYRSFLDSGIQPSLDSVMDCDLNWNALFLGGRVTVQHPCRLILTL
jgi:hypothetical protein